jgi:hypothetical protein
MFDSDWIADLDADAACEAIRRTQDELREREWREIALAAHWAVLHDEHTLPARIGPPPEGAERVRRAGGEGTPLVAEFACGELAVLMGTGFISADNLMSDALDLQHRHPRMWAALAMGQGRVWKARKVARMTRAAGLDRAQARVVDEATTPHVDSMPWASFERLVSAEIIAVDPAAAEQRRRARELEQFVSAGQSDEHGLKTLVARAEAGDIIVFLAMCDRIAQILLLEGDTSPVGARRARAVGILAQPAQALAMLQRHAARPAEPEDEPEDEAEAPRCPTCGHGPGAVPFPVDPDKLRPKALLHLRISEEALRARRGVAVLENAGVGPITASEAIDLLGHCHVTVRPIVDLRDQLPVDCYEIPDAMRETVRLSRPSSVFPWTHTGTHSADLDHTRPYVRVGEGGAPGQTRVDNLGPMVRFGHRIKTHGRGWRHRQPVPGVYLWRTPHGYWCRVDRHGTHGLGRDPDSLLELRLTELIRAA